LTLPEAGKPGYVSVTNATLEEYKKESRLINLRLECKENVLMKERLDDRDGRERIEPP
jgi:hypothetical protein